MHWNQNEVLKAFWKIYYVSGETTRFGYWGSAATWTIGPACFATPTSLISVKRNIATLMSLDFIIKYFQWRNLIPIILLTGERRFIKSQDLMPYTSNLLTNGNPIPAVLNSIARNLSQKAA